MLEAWGPDLASCCEEAVAALVAVYVEPSRRTAVGQRDVDLPPAPDEALLLGVLDEVIFTLDTAEDMVPVAAGVRSAADGGLDVVPSLAALRHVEGTGDETSDHGTSYGGGPITRLGPWTLPTARHPDAR